MAVVSLVGCAVSGGGEPGGQSSQGGSPAQAGGTPSVRGTLDSAALEDIQHGLELNGRTFNATSYRVAGLANVADTRVQMIQMARKKGGSRQANKVDFNVTTGAPIRTTPTTYGDSWTSNARNDMVAFATDASTFANNSLVGVTGGVSNGTLSNSVQKSDLMVITDLYPGLSGAGSSPYVLYTNNAHSETYVHGGLFFNFDSTNTQLFSLATSSKIYCNKSPKWTGSGSLPSTSSFANCGGWGGSGFAGGTSTTVTWSSPYPMFSGTGDVNRVYWGTDNGQIACISISSPTSAPAQCTGFPLTLNSGVKMGPPTVFTTAGQFVVFMGDENGILWEVDDNGTATPTTGSYRLCGGTGTASCGTPYQVHGAPAFDFSGNNAFVAANGTVFKFPLSFSASPSPSATVALDSSVTWTDPIDSSPSPDFLNSVLYVTANNTLYKTPYTLASVTKTSLLRQETSAVELGTQTINPQSQPVGYPLAYNGNVYVDTGAGGTSTSTKTGEIEEYGCASSSTTAPGFEGVTLPSGTRSTYGVLASTGDVLDFATGDLVFGYDNGQSSAGKDGSGGLVGYNLPTTNWGCPAPYSTGTLACGGTGCVVAAGSCISDSDCSGTTPFCSPANKCVACVSDTQCTAAHGTGWICANGGSAPSYTCIQGAHCTSDTNCSSQSTKKSCDTTNTSPYFDTCQQCATGKTTSCTGATAVCVLDTTDPNYDSCKACDAANVTACTSAGQVCDTTAGDVNQDSCVGCSPPSSTSGNGCATTRPICNASSTCIECQQDTDCPGFVNGNTLLSCTSSNVCTCVSAADCPGGSTCTANRCQ
jgi:hypothetical protein